MMQVLYLYPSSQTLLVTGLFGNQVPRDTSPLNDQRCKIWMNATCSVFTANYEDPLKSVGFLNDRFEIHSINSAYNFPDFFSFP